MKLAGSILILFAAVWTAADILHARRVKLHSLRQLSELLMQICGELEARALPIPELLEVLPGRTSGAGKDLVNRLRDSMSRLGTIGFSELWDEAFLHVFPAAAEEVRRVMHRAGLALGRYELKRQCEVLDRCAKDLEIFCERDEKELSRSRQLLWGLSLVSAALLILLLN